MILCFYCFQFVCEFLFLVLAVSARLGSFTRRPKRTGFLKILKNKNMLSPLSQVLLSSLYIASNLPPDIQRDIVLKFEKNVKRDTNFANFGRGTSKSAAKKRAKYFGKCWKCGALIHANACKDLPTTSQLECAFTLRQDPITLKAQKILRPNSNASALVDELIAIRRSKLKSNTSK